MADRFCEPPSAQLDLDSVLHMCSQKPCKFVKFTKFIGFLAHIREEVRLLLLDLRLRIKRSVFAGFSTAFLSIALPCFFVPVCLMYNLLILFIFSTKLRKECR